MLASKYGVNSLCFKFLHVMLIGESSVKRPGFHLIEVIKTDITNESQSLRVHHQKINFLSKSPITTNLVYTFFPVLYVNKCGHLIMIIKQNL